MSPSGWQFLEEGDKFSMHTPPTRDTSGKHDSSAKFDESWPSSERPSTVSIPEYISPVSETSTPSLRPTVLVGGRQSAEPTQPRTTLQRYIDRFRHGKPLSKEERKSKKLTDPNDFWWLSSSALTPDPSSSSTPRDSGEPLGGNKTVRRRPVSPVKREGSRPWSGTSRPYVAEKLSASVNTLRPQWFQEEEESIKMLQEKTDRLLERSASSSDAIVSTVGLGSSPSISSFDEPMYRPQFARDRVPPQPPPPMPGPIQQLLPGTDQDILQQWRARRRLDQMQERIRQGHGMPPTGQGYESSEIENKLAEFRKKLAVSDRVQECTGAGTGKQQGQSSGTESKEKADKSCGTEPESPRSRSAPSSPKRAHQGLSAAPQRQEGTPRASHAHSAPSSPIASPSVQRKQCDRGGVSPHFHLLCDILPCPHSPKICPEDVSSSQISSQEQPEREIESHLSDSEITRNCTSSAANRKCKGRSRNLKKYFDESDNVQKEKQSKTETDTYLPPLLHGNMTDKPCNEKYGKQTKKKHLKEKNYTLKENYVNKNLKNEPVKSTRYKEISRSANSIGRSQCSRSMKKNGMPHPTLASSPRHRTKVDVLQSAIGKAVSDHLFHNSTASSSSSGACPAEQSEEEISVELSTDDSEFPEDELLQMLRSRRRHYESQLREIDNLLEQNFRGREGQP
ncbi:uncharacterized protein LOC106176878 isoform X2 [Lingula anatina]|nr:uncharacterized protein LOC106176878 isoform X2 [Lingula anatina]|eukprot:XP_013414898.1 uncharacterized protein LOC106176878 isoform X2 [Lingula anatina]